MAIEVKHKFVSPLADGGDTDLVRPSNWNDTHNLELATARLVGRTTAGAGAAEEISVDTSLSLTGGELSFSTSWGDGRYLQSESDPVFTASPAGGILAGDITNWDAAYSWGNHASAGYLTSAVTSVGLSVPTGLTVTGSPITSTGTLALTFTAGYSIPTTTKQGQWDTAYGWGDHASVGYAMETVTLTAGTGLTGGGTLAANRTFNVDMADDAAVRAGTADKVVAADHLYSANAPVVSSGSGNFSLDLKSGRVFERTLTGNSTMTGPYNVVPGQSGVIYIVQDATGGRTLAIGFTWKTKDGEVPAIDETANAVNVFSYYARTATHISLRYLGVEA